MKRLTRSRDDKWLTGVCGGIGRYTGVDPNLVRLLAVVLTVVGVGTTIVVYLLAWLLMPKDDGTITVWPNDRRPTDPGPPPPSH